MVHPLRAISVATALVVLAAVSGCVTYKAMTPKQRDAIKSVSIAESVPVPDFPLVFGPSTNIGALFFGGLAALAATSKDNPDGLALKRMIADHGIDLGKIARQEFVKVLRQAGSFPRVDVEQADATFDLTIESYGLGAAGFTPLSPINNPLRPHMRLAAKLTNRNGEVLWQDSGYFASNSETILEGRTFDEILADPEYTEMAFRWAARLASREVLKSLPEGCNPGHFEPAYSRC